LTTLQGHSSYVTATAFSPDGKYLASGSWDCTVKLWSFESRNELSMLQGSSSFLISVIFSFDGKYMASACQNNQLKLWSMES
jgi:WD40 repeat protein